MTSSVQRIMITNLRTEVSHGFGEEIWSRISNVEFAVANSNASVILPVWTNLDLGFEAP